MLAIGSARARLRSPLRTSKRSRASSIPARFISMKSRRRSIFEGLRQWLAHRGNEHELVCHRRFQTGRWSVGLGVDELRWPQPVRPGDILKVETEVLDVRKSRSKPDRGIIRIRNVTTNQHGEVVQTFLALVVVNAVRRRTDHDASCSARRLQCARSACPTPTPGSLPPAGLF